MNLVMKICERIQVLDFGTTIASGTPEQIANDPHVIVSSVKHRCRALIPLQRYERRSCYRFVLPFVA